VTHHTPIRSSQHFALSRRRLVAIPALAVMGSMALVAMGVISMAAAAQPTINLGSATSYGVLAGTTVTNTGATTVSGNLGVDPGSAVTGFPPGTVINGVKEEADALALQAQAGLTAAFIDAAGRTPATAEPYQIGGQSLVPGIYKDASAMHLTGTVTLNAEGDSSAVFIFQVGSSLITASDATVSLIGGTQPCNVFWQVGSSAVLGTGTHFVGTVMALTSITAATHATVRGRLLARNGEVSLASNTITAPTCHARPAAATTTTTTPTTTTPTTVPTTSSSTIPLGAPQTGFGGAAQSPGNPLMWFAGAVGLAGVAVLAEGARRRHGRGRPALSARTPTRDRPLDSR
jgi:hypothetical protein